MVLPMAGSISPMVDVLFKMSDNWGKVRDVPVTGLNDLKMGPVVLGLFGGPAGPRSYSSQQKVRASPSGSDPLPDRMKGVLFGIV